MTGESRQRRPIARALAVTMLALVAGELVTATACALIAGISFADAVGSFTVTNGAMGLTFPVCGALLAWQRPRNAIGWLFLAAGLGHATSAAAVQLLGVGARSGWNLGALRLLAALFSYAWPWSVGLLLPMALLLFPDGRLISPRWRPIAWAAAAEGLLFVASSASPYPAVIAHRALVPYLAIAAYGKLGLLWMASNIAWALILTLAIASLALRYRRGGESERKQLLWLLLAVLIVLAFAGVPWGIFGIGPVLGLLVIPLIPIAVTIAILRYQLLDIRLVISRTLLYGVLTAGAAGSYIGLVALLDAMVRSRVSLASAVVASIVVAIAFHPIRVRLQDLIDRGLYGDRRDPVRAVSRIGERLADTGAVGLSGVLEALCDSLRLPFAAARYGAAEVAAHGDPPALMHAVSLSYDGARIGELIVGLRSGQRRLGQPDLAVLDLLAGPLAVALHATALSAALQQSRVSIVGAREEERRRLRRDLHDGLGPALTGIAFKADAARNTLASEPSRAAALLGELRSDTAAAITDVRRLVYGLRPPALDDLGLIGSLGQLSERLGQRAEGGGLTVRMTTPPDLPPLPAAVEVAAYRIITEAMTNAVKHSGAAMLEVQLALAGDGLLIEVRDDGHRRAAGWQPGFGLTSMRERAAELGGWCEASPDPAGGGRVLASLPLGRLQPDDEQDEAELSVP